MEDTQIVTLPATLSHAVKRYTRVSRANNTRRGYRADFRIFSTWAEHRGLPYFPSTPDVVSMFLADEADSGTVSAATIARRVSAIVHAHKRAKLPSPVDDEVRLVLQGIRRTLGTAPLPKAPLVAEQIKAMIDAIDREIPATAHELEAFGEPIKPLPTAPQSEKFAYWMLKMKQATLIQKGVLLLRDKALILIGFGAALRRTELGLLATADVDFKPEGGLLLTIRRSKTDQEGQGQQIAIVKAAESRYDASEALRAWLEAGRIGQGQIFGLGGFQISKILKRRAAAAGIDPANISGHSLRSGALTTGANAGASIGKLLELSRHASLNTLQRYLRPVELSKNAALKDAL
jgi:site-specific recombinase XerD